jgi:short-subunit dehydrogenase
MNTSNRKFAIVTGASTGIGYELAKGCAERGYDLLVVADEAQIYDAAHQLRSFGVDVEGLLADLSTPDGVSQVTNLIAGRQVDALLANAGRGLGHAFLDQDFRDILQVINTNVTGTLQLIHVVGRHMRAARTGRILVTGSIAGLMPGAFQAVYNGTKALLDSFCYALREELKDSGVSVTCLMPGATDTEFFRRAGMLDTKVGTDDKQSPEEVAKAGIEAMLSGDADVVTGFSNKVMAAMSHVVPSTALAEQHRKLAEPGTAR